MQPTAGHRRSPCIAAALLLAIPALALLPAASASASWGLYFDYGLGPIDSDDDFLGGASYDSSRIGVGLSTDSAVAKDKLFNNRFSIGYEHFSGSLGGTTFEKFNGGSLENIFGFGVYRSKLMRVWLGPSLRLAVGVLDEEKSLITGGPVPGSLINLTAGGGIAAGINIHTGDIGSAAFTIGYQYAYQGRFLTSSPSGVPSYFQGRDQRVNFNFAYFFRGAGDRFEK